MLKTVIIGAGNISYPHGEALRSLGVEIAGVLDFDPTRAKAFAEKYGGRVLEKLDEVPAEVDMVHLFTPPSKRVEYVRQAAAAGKHIFIEKPIATTVADAAEIVAAAEKNKVKLMVGFNHRFRDGYRMLRETVREGRLGEVISVFFHRLSAGAGIDGQINSGWRTNPELVCGMSVESLSHDIDMLLHLVDGVESVSANAYGTIPALPTFDTNAAVSFRLKGGGVGMILSSWSSRVGYGARGVIGTKGTAMLTGDNFMNFNELTIKTQDMEHETVIRVNDRFDMTSGVFDAPSVFRTVNRLFLDSIEGDTAPPATGEDGLRALVFSQAILESSRSGRAVAVNL